MVHLLKINNMKATYLHYDNGKDYDVIDIIKDYQLNFNKGNIIKYICRAGKKDNEIKDLEKALDYLKREIEYLRSEQKKWIERNK